MALQELLELLRLVLLLLHELLPLLIEERLERGLLLGAQREQLCLLPLLLQLLVHLLLEELHHGVGGPLSLPHGEQPPGEPPQGARSVDGGCGCVAELALEACHN